MGLKKKTGIWIVGMSMLLLLEGCSNKNRVVSYSEDLQEVTSITFFGYKYEPENVKVIEEIISDFMKENPDIRVSYESLAGAEYYPALLKRMEAGKVNDVFMVNHDTALVMKEAGYLADLSGLETISGYTDQMLDQMQEEDGRVYWVPTTVSVFGLYCNMDLLRSYDQSLPKNLTDWENSCDYFLEQGITPVIANNDISFKTAAIGKGFYPLYQQEIQKEVFSRLNQGEVRLSEYLYTGFAFVDQWIKKGYVDAKKTLVTKKNSDELNEFIKGGSPFMLTGAWSIAVLKSKKPDFEFQVIPLPLREDGSLLVINADTRLSVNAKGENQETAAKFVEYFTRQDNIQKFSDQQSSFCPLKQGILSDAKEIQEVVSCYRSGHTVIGSDSHLFCPIWDLTAQATEKLLAGEELEEAMDWLDQQTEGEGRIQE